MTFLCSFLASILTDTFGIRKTAVLGGILATSGMLASSLVTSLYQLYFTYGIMFGIGASLAYTPSLVILGHYFNRRLGIVNGVVTAGSSVFTMIMSISLKAIIEVNDFPTNMRILAGLMSLLILCGLTFIEKNHKNKKNVGSRHGGHGTDVGVDDHDASTGNRIKAVMRTTSSSSNGSTASTQDEEMIVDVNQLKTKCDANGSSSSGYSETSSAASNCSKLEEYGCNDGKVWFNRKIWKNQMYRLWVLAIPVALFGYFVPYVHLVNHVSQILPDVNGAILVTIIGASSGLGRIIFGNIADAPGVNRSVVDMDLMHVSNSCLLGNNRIFLQQIAFISIGVLTLLLTVTHNMYCMIVICVGLGIFDGCFISVLGPIAFDLVGRNGASQAIGFLLAFCSIPLTVGPPIAGKWLKVIVWNWPNSMTR